MNTGNVKIASYILERLEILAEENKETPSEVLETLAIDLLEKRGLWPPTEEE